MKRKRGFYYYSKDEENPKKRLKFEDDIQKIPFLSENMGDSTVVDVFDEEKVSFEKIQKKNLNEERHVIVPSELGKNEKFEVTSIVKTKNEKLQKKALVPFSSINNEKNVERVFGKVSKYLPKLEIKFPGKFSEIVTERAKSLMEEYNWLIERFKGKKEATDSVYIKAVIVEAIKIAETGLNRILFVEKEEEHEGNEAYGKLDFEIRDDENLLVIVEAKRTVEYDIKGVPQLLMQLKAMQEKEGMKDKWYYGFSATRKLWTPCRVNMKRKKVQIGMEQTINTAWIGSFERVLYLMKGMILREFDNI